MPVIEQRQLKFRAWLFVPCEMVEITGLNWEHDGSMIIKCGCRYKYLPVVYYTIPDQAVLIRPAGLKDKNGVEIYEDDILRYSGAHLGNANIHYFRIIFKDGCFEADVSAGWCPYLRSINEESEVVGNIYQHPNWKDWG